jgi:hypothetical protein
MGPASNLNFSANLKQYFGEPQGMNKATWLGLFLFDTVFRLINDPSAMIILYSMSHHQPAPPFLTPINQSYCS